MRPPDSPRALATILGSALLALALLAAVLLDLGPFSDDETEEVEATVERFVESGNARDFDTVCSLLSREAIREIERSAGELGLSRKAGCARILDERSGGDPGGDASIEINDSRVDGARAEVDVELQRDGPSRMLTVELRRESGEWRIATSVE